MLLLHHRPARVYAHDCHKGCLSPNSSTHSTHTHPYATSQALQAYELARNSVEQFVANVHNEWFSSVEAGVTRHLHANLLTQEKGAGAANNMVGWVIATHVHSWRSQGRKGRCCTPAEMQGGRGWQTCLPRTSSARPRHLSLSLHTFAAPPNLAQAAC